jgi:nicotinamidase-related amidase
MGGEEMRIRGLALALAILIGIGNASAQPIRPEPVPATLDPSTTAVLVLDLNARCEDPGQICGELIPALHDFLPRARNSGAFVVYTVSAQYQGTALERMARGIEPAPGEPVIFPDAFNKFVTGELEAILAARGIRTLVATGSSSNVGVHYTVVSALRDHRYNVVIPMDGMNAGTPYEEEYSLHQLSVLPGGVQSQLTFTRLDLIDFGRP